MTENGNVSNTAAVSVTGLDDADVTDTATSAGVMSVCDIAVEQLPSMPQQSEVEMVTDAPPKKKSKKKSLSSPEQSLKREGDEPSSEESLVKRRKRSSGGGDVTKNALQTLNELVPGLQYNCISQTGPVHQPTFTVQVQVNDQV